MAINEAAFFYPSDLVNTKTTNPSGSASRLGIYPPFFTDHERDGCFSIYYQIRWIKKKAGLINK